MTKPLLIALAALAANHAAACSCVDTDGWTMVQGFYTFAGSASSLLAYIESSSATASYYEDDFSVRVVPAVGCSDPPDTSGIH
jgi:hypothetical protein